jgi:hypothetical protein
MFSNDPKKFKNGSLDTRWYKHPKYCYYVNDPDNVYKVIGYHYGIEQYKIQSTIDYKIIMVGPFDIAGIWDRSTLEKLKKQHG